LHFPEHVARNQRRQAHGPVRFQLFDQAGDPPIRGGKLWFQRDGHGSPLQTAVQIENRRHPRRGRELAHRPATRFLAHAPAQGRVLDQTQQTRGKLGHVARLEEQAGAAVDNVFRDAADAAGDDGQAAGIRQLAGIAKAKAEGKKWGGRKVGTRIRLSVEKEALIRQLYAEGKAVAAIARLVGLSRKSVYKALEPTRKIA
jgi:hypothetical protein